MSSKIEVISVHPLILTKLYKFLCNMKIVGDNIYSLIYFLITMSLKIIGKRYIGLILVINDQYVGYINAHINHNTAYISDLIIKNEFRGRGLGKKLAIAMLNRLNNMNVEEIYVDVEEDNYIAVNLWTRLGFKPIKRFVRCSLKLERY